MHCVHDVCEGEVLVGQEFLELVSGVTVNPVPCRTAGNGFAYLGKVFGGKAQFARIPGHFTLLTAVLLDIHQESQEMAAKYDIQIESWFPLGGRDSHGEILRDPVINAIAKAHGKSAAQVIIRWHLQKGFCVVPGSSNPAHIQENIESFSFTLSDDEMKQIAALNKEKRYFNMTYEQI